MQQDDLSLSTASGEFIYEIGNQIFKELLTIGLLKKEDGLAMIELGASIRAPDRSTIQCEFLALKGFDVRVYSRGDLATLALNIFLHEGHRTLEQCIKDFQR
ncbi:hypothetical protein [Enterovibrio norvegicus]|uniref:hypothetical protein n=1 Tax=Enterovibrio norvegicus TaxID=188144 RepID=UPI000C858B63|nr:hypothetical protein [Enterovibrio norvegicus]PMH64503.1 hypothetical protein BCU62_15730 [Enterovibrio norvegicus]